VQCCDSLGRVGPRQDGLLYSLSEKKNQKKKKKSSGWLGTPMNLAILTERKVMRWERKKKTSFLLGRLWTGLEMRNVADVYWVP